MHRIDRIHYLVEKLNNASNAYYGGLDEIMSNYEWDSLFDELHKLENETGYILPNSPTSNVSKSDTSDSKNKEAHEFSALSLAKTKSITDLQSWAGNLDVWISWKLDGLTLVLTYDNGTLTKILTRGDGRIGSNITFMKRAIRGIPLNIAYMGHLVVRGEAVISYSDFEYVNGTLDNDEVKYANPRNLAAGTLGLDDSKLDVVRDRRVTFIAFSLIWIDKEIFSWGERMHFLDKLGFLSVDREITNAVGLPTVIEKWTNKVETGRVDFPVDGLVICYDDTEYAATGNVTEHHATRAGLAFKWQDTIATTTMDHIEWSCATSCITPIAVFDAVQLEGTTISRASLCNIGEMERLGIGENRRTVLKIIKSNKIIPKCIGVVRSEGNFSVPSKCPVCNGETKIKVNSQTGTKTLHCLNVNCPAKHLRRFMRFVSKPGADIDGLSIQTLSILVNNGFMKDFSDIYHLYEHWDNIVKLDGFGDKSCKKLFSAIEHSRKINPANFIYALSIPSIGTDAAKRIVTQIGLNSFLSRLNEGIGFEDIDGIGPERSTAILSWFNIAENRQSLVKLLAEVVIYDSNSPDAVENIYMGMTFVVTGNVYLFNNRTNLKQYIENRGGKVTNTVSKNTSYLITNDSNSTSAKSKKAKELGVPIISEQEFLNLLGNTK